MELQATSIENNPLPHFCKYCSKPVGENDIFCLSCGKRLKPQPASLSILSLIWLLTLSTLLPPLGIGLTIRYIKDQNPKARIIGWVSVFLTLTMITITYFVAKSYFESLNEQVNQALQNYQF